MLKNKKKTNETNNLKVKKETKQNLKKKIVNSLIKNGHKRTCEKLLLTSFKIFQTAAFKNYKNIVKLAVKNATPIFLIKKVKKGKKKRRKEIQIPFIAKENIRLGISVKNITSEIIKKKNFSNKYCKNLTKEFYFSAKKEGKALEKKIELQEQTLALKKRLSRFRWF